MSTDLSCQKTRSQFTRHLSLSARPRSTGGVGRHSQRHGEAVLPKRPGEALQTHPNHKCKIKGNSSKSRFGPKQEGGQVSAGQCPSERGEVTTWCKNTPHRGEDGSRARRALRHPALVPSETRGPAHDHRLAVTTDILTLHDQEGLKGHTFTTRIFQPS